MASITIRPAIAVLGVSIKVFNFGMQYVLLRLFRERCSTCLSDQIFVWQMTTKRGKNAIETDSLDFGTVRNYLTTNKNSLAIS